MVIQLKEQKKKKFRVMLKTCLLLEEIKKGVERRATIVTAALS
jgi:hypothetical protein